MEFITDSIITGMFDNTHIKARLFLKFIVDKSAVIKLVINKTAYPKYEQYELFKSKVITILLNTAVKKTTKAIDKNTDFRTNPKRILSVFFIKKIPHISFITGYSGDDLFITLIICLTFCLTF